MNKENTNTQNPTRNLRGLRTTAREIRKPYVMVNKKLGILSVIYKDRVENYKLEKVETKADIDKSNGEEVSYEYEDIYGKGWNKEHEHFILKDNGFRHIQFNERVADE